MTTLRAYSIFDVKIRAYSPPFYAVNDGMAGRMLTDLVNDPTTSIGRHPRDFSLFCLGVFDDSTGALEGFTPRVFVAEAASLLPNEQQTDLFNKEPA